MPIFVIPTCEGRRVGWIQLYFVLSSEDVYIYLYSLIIINYTVDDVE